MLDNYGHKLTLGICNNYFFFDCNISYANATQCYITRTLLILLLVFYLFLVKLKNRKAQIKSRAKINASLAEGYC